MFRDLERRTPFRPADGVPHELTADEIAKIIAAFAAAARRAVAAGLKLIEIHGAHGYLLNEFMSPLANQRSDQYCGSFENRIRFTLEAIRAVCIAIPAEIPLSMKLSAVDSADGSWSVDDSVRLAFLRGPYFPLHAAKALGVKAPFPRQYTPAYM